MQKLLSSLLLLVALSVTLLGQPTDPLATTTITSLSDVPHLQLPALDNKQLLEDELARRGPGIAPRFAETMEVDVSPATHGLWTQEDGLAVWRLRVPSPGARSLNFGFDQFFMPAGGKLMLYSPDLQEMQGPFTPADNEEHAELWTPVIEGDEIVIEVSLPQDKISELQLHLKSVNHDFLGFTSMSSLLSGSCNLDVVCGAEDGWGIVDGYRDIIQSVAVYGTNGNTFCTGFLVNNARQDCTPFFMTANHCGIGNGNAASVVIYWNFISSVCRQPNSPASGGNGGGSLADFNTGAIHRSSYAPSDMTLIELDDPVSPTADAWFAGWDAREELAQDTIIAIHHPSTDEKRISFQFDGVYTGAWGSGPTAVPNGDHLIIEDWEIGTTEGGSSGSPIFNNDKQVIGQLHGGGAACGNNAYDSYGWMFTSWEGGGNPNSRLKDWLDPDNTGMLVMDGRAQLLCSFFAQAEPAAQTLCAPAAASYNITTSENFASTITLSITGLPAGLTAVFDDPTVTPGESTQLAITGTGNLTTGTYTFVLNGTDGANSTTQTLTLNVNADVAAAPALAIPADQATDQFTTISLNWNTVNLATSYDAELATDPAFANIIASESGLSGTNFLSPSLMVSTTYYWRVRATNVCGTGDWSTAFSFETGALACGIIPADTDGLTIGPNANVITTSNLVIDQEGEIASIRVTGFSTNHTYTGDLEATLTSPDGITIQLFAQPDCDEPGMLVNFDDNAAATAATFNTTCNPGGVSIQGDFQPFQPLSTFNGELASGTWILRVTDNFNQDGGELLGWNLDICTLLPNTVSLTPSETMFTACANQNLSLDLTVGNGFNGNVNLSATNLPMGASANFEDNDVAPGSTVNVIISGLTDLGNLSINFAGTDGTDMAESTIDVTVIDVPASSVPIAPLDNATDVDIINPLSWMAVDNSDSYAITLSTNADLSDPLVDNFPAINTALSPGTLEYNTVYYWSISPTNSCGATDAIVIYSFTTAPNLTVTANQDETTHCIADGAILNFVLGEGLGGEHTVNITAEPAGDFSNFTQSFDPDTRELSLDWANFVGLSSDDYTLTITITGEGYSGDVNSALSVLTSPALTSLQLPADQSMVSGGTMVDFSWQAVDAAEDYTLEVATDDSFANIVYEENSSTTTLSVELASGQYFWRITSANDCGDSVSEFFVFTFETTATVELAGTRLDIWPNPTRGPLQIALSAELNGQLDVSVYAANGQKVSDYQLPATAGTQSLDLGDLPAGVYLLRLTNGQAQATARVIVE